MSKTYLSLDIGDKKLGLKYNMGALETIVELTGRDDIGVFVSKDLCINIYAGLMGNAMAKDEELDLTLDDVRKIVRKWDFEEAQKASDIVTAFIVGAYPQKKEISGEGINNTQSEALDVAGNANDRAR
jgi:hypothetical protein